MKSTFKDVDKQFLPESTLVLPVLKLPVQNYIQSQTTIYLSVIPTECALYRLLQSQIRIYKFWTCIGFHINRLEVYQTVQDNE